MSTRATVLAYHGVADCRPEDDPHNLFIAPAAFERQMAYLARRRRVVALDDLVEGTLPSGPPAVALTFDDAYRSVLTDAAPVLQSFGFPATVFVPTRFVGGRNTWDPPSAAPLDIMGAQELREAEAAGVRVESHGHAHINLEEADEAQAREDLQASVEALESLLGRRPRYLAYPFRTASPTVQRIAAELGFAAAFSIDLPGDGPYARPRVQVTPLDGPRLFALKTTGHYLRLRHWPPLAQGYALAKRLLRRSQRD